MLARCQYNMLKLEILYFLILPNDFIDQVKFFKKTWNKTKNTFPKTIRIFVKVFLSSFLQANNKGRYLKILCCFYINSNLKHRKLNLNTLVVQFVAESRFANCGFANLFFDLDELQFS